MNDPAVLRPRPAARARAGVGRLALPACARPASCRIEEVKPGMVGVGRTVFEGTELQDFKVHILGVLQNVQAPQRNLILARLEGGPLAETGVIAGHERQPGLHRRPPGRRGLVFDRLVSEGTDRRHHADRRDDRSDDRRAPRRATARRRASSCRSRREPRRRAARGLGARRAVRRSARPTCRRSGSPAASRRRRSARCCGRSRRRS